MPACPSVLLRSSLPVLPNGTRLSVPPLSTPQDLSFLLRQCAFHPRHSFLFPLLFAQNELREVKEELKEKMEEIKQVTG